MSTQSFIGVQEIKGSRNNITLYNNPQFHSADNLNQSGDDLQKLRSTLRVVEILINKADWWQFQNKNVAKLLTEVKDAKYDADDLLDEFNYEKLKQKVEGTEESGRVSQLLISGNASTVKEMQELKQKVEGTEESGSVKSGHVSQLLSKVSNFTRGMISGKASTVKEMQELKQKVEGTEESGCVSQLLISGKASNVRHIQGRLDDVYAALKQALELLDTNDGLKQYGKSVRRKTSSFMIDPEPFGRDEEKEKLIKLLRQSNDGVGSSKDNGDGSVASCSKRRKKETVSVLPIVGMGGLGKTTLAQMVYNDQRVCDHFQLRIWVCVSNFFDVTRLTKEIVGNVFNFINLDSVQLALKQKVMSKKFLLVLDDVWNEDSSEWQQLCAPLRCGLEGSMILVTTRSEKVSEITKTMDPLFLKGLPKDTYLEFFNKCAFGSENPQQHPELHNIAKEIATKLKGSPLAAKTLGGLLNTNLDVRRWRAIANSQMWRLPQGESDILPALRLSYQYLPAHLKPCFSFCSMFPKSYWFGNDNLVSMWEAEGLITPQGDEDQTGASYFSDLISRSFFQRTIDREYFVMHDLIHDLAQSVSADECLCIQTSEWKQIMDACLRHLSINTSEFDVMLLGGYKKLHALVFLGPLNNNLNSSTNFLISELTKLHILVLMGFQMKELPESIGNLKHLRYLDISVNQIAKLPESIGQLYNLQHLDLVANPLENIPEHFTKLISLRKLYAFPENISMISRIGNLTSLQNLLEFKVQKKDGHRIGELRNMTLLSGNLNVKNLENVAGREDAAQATFTNKKYLDGLRLYWSNGRTDDYALDEEVLEGLQPHSNLKELTIVSYGGCKFPPWLQSLCCLGKISISDCMELTSLPPALDSLATLENLTIKNCPKIRCIGKLVLPPQLKKLILDSCGDLEMSIPNLLQNLISLSTLVICNCPHITSLEGQVLCHLSALSELTICNCEQLIYLGRLPDPLFLKKLCVVRCPKLIEVELFISKIEEKGKRESQLVELTISNTSFVKILFLRNPPSSLKKLRIEGSTESLMFIGEDKEWLLSLKSLNILELEDCPNLQALPDELHMLTSLHGLDINDCPKIKSLPEKGLPASIRAYGVKPL